MSVLMPFKLAVGRHHSRALSKQMFGRPQETPFELGVGNVLDFLIHFEGAEGEAL